MRVRVEAMTRIKLLVLSGVLFLLPICLKAGVSVRRPSFEADTVYTDRPDTVKLDMPYRSGISIRDNIFWNIAGAPNLGVEIPVGKHFSVGANGAFKPQPRFFLWDNDGNNNSKWKHLAFVPEFRYWPKEVYEGWFMGSDLVYTHYNTGDVKFPLGLYPDVRDHRVQGDY